MHQWTPQSHCGQIGRRKAPRFWPYRWDEALRDLMRGSILDTNKPGGDPIHEERLKRYRLSYWGSFIGSYDTAKEAYESYKIHETIRPMIDRESKGSV
jgi:hypothetical protein